MATPAFTVDEKIDGLKREIALRHKVYAGRVERGTMTRQEADREIALFETILQDYYRVRDRLARKRNPSLFDS